MIVRFLGEASIEIEDDLNILIDPHYETEPKNKPDIILVTHEHDDHFDQEILKKYPDTSLYGPQSFFDKFSVEGKVIESGDNIKDEIKVLDCDCYGSDESVCYYYKGIYHTADSADYPKPDQDVKLMFTACFKDFFNEYLTLVKDIKPDIVIPYHFNSKDNDAVQEAMELNKILREAGYDSRLLKPGDFIKFED
ncbi:MAG TPA: MBL fold metallo-hydrolase [Halanaerobiales bacterium]|nr:MBL fold metallo-hydrolase [Halanaerobiales bacterium]